MFLEHSRNIPFTIKNFSYLDPLGRESVTWVRTFATSRHRRFDAYMIYSQERKCIVDYLGTHQHLAVDLELSVAEGPIAFQFPLFFSGVADICEWCDDNDQCFRMEVSATNSTWGKLSVIAANFR